MPDITTITAAIQSLRVASDLLTGLRTADAAFQKAELKLQVANLVGALADARTHMSDVQELVAAKDAELALLRDALSIKAKVVRHGDAYYTADDGEPSGSAFCPRCWEVDHRLLHLVRVANGHANACPQCRCSFDVYLTGEIREKPRI